MDTRYRLLAVDVDGTLLDSSSELPAANREALHRAHEAGLVICICTGRCFSETRPVIERIGLDLDVAACVFGSLLCDARTGRTLHRWPVARRMAMRLIEFLRLRGHPVLVLQDADEAGLDYYVVAGTRTAAAYDRWLELAPTVARRVDEWPADAPEPLRIAIIDDPDGIEACRVEMVGEFSSTEVKVTTIFAPNYGLHVLECFAPHVNKWFAVSRLARDHGIAASQVVAIGDDVNDFEMVRSAGLGVAMGNARPMIRDAGRVQTSTNDEDGVARFIDRLLAGEFNGER
jgi:Cof subfamily protein (haloacid dehalogenase superfamily)